MNVRPPLEFCPVPDTFTMVRTNLTDANVRELHALQRAAYAVESDRINYPNLPPLRETSEELLRSPEHWLLGRADGGLAGALAFLSPPGLLEISRLFVAPTHFKKGFASRLLREIERYADPGHRIIVSTAAANRPAIALYEKHGYRIIRRKMTDDGLSLVGLEKALRG